MKQIILKIMANKHTSGAGIVYIVCMAISKFGAIWFPDHSAQFQQTADVVKEMAVAYGFIMGADAAKKETTGEPEKPSNKGTTIVLLIAFGLAYFAATHIAKAAH